eukprot:1715739-Rhodomonas_salina.3
MRLVWPAREEGLSAPQEDPCSAAELQCAEQTPRPHETHPLSHTQHNDLKNCGRTARPFDLNEPWCNLQRNAPELDATLSPVQQAHLTVKGVLAGTRRSKQHDPLTERLAAIVDVPIHLEGAKLAALRPVLGQLTHSVFETISSPLPVPQLGDHLATSSPPRLMSVFMRRQ